MGWSRHELVRYQRHEWSLVLQTGADFENPTDSDVNNLYEVWVRVSDGYSTDDQKLNLRIIGVDEIPSVSPAKFSTTEDTPIIVTFTVSDPEGQISDASLLTPTSNGYFSWSAYPLTSESDIKFTYTPNPNYHGADFMVLRVSDGTVQGDVTIPIEINATADPPTANPACLFTMIPRWIPFYWTYWRTTAVCLIRILRIPLRSPPMRGRNPSTACRKLGYRWDCAVLRPAKDFIGIDTFEYTIIDTNDSLESTATVTVVQKRAAKYPNWRFSETLGYYNLTTTNWIYHTDLGWLYLENRGGLETTTWIWSDKVGWFWTGEARPQRVFERFVRLVRLHREGVGWSESQAIYDLADLRSDKKDMDDRSGFDDCPCEHHSC